MIFQAKTLIFCTALAFAGCEAASDPASPEASAPAPDTAQAPVNVESTPQPETITLAGRNVTLGADCRLTLGSGYSHIPAQSVNTGLTPSCRFLRHSGDEWVEEGTLAKTELGDAEIVLILGRLENSCTDSVRALAVSPRNASLMIPTTVQMHCQGEVLDDKDYWSLIDPFAWYPSD